MITQETLSRCLEQAKLFWKTGDTKHLNLIHAFLEACLPGDEYEDERDIAYEIAHICARRKLNVEQMTKMLIIAKIEVEGVNNG